jgi:hypothetical protein
VAELTDEIARLERVKSAAAAGQARLTAVLADIGRDSSARGGHHQGFATALVFEMPHTLAALECGVLSEWRATLIV